MSARPTDAVFTRLKKRKRGWHFDREPGFYGVRKKFEEMDKRHSPEKLASIRDRAYRDALGKFALLDGVPKPVEAIADLFATTNFGYGEDAAPKARQSVETPVSFGRALGGGGTELGDRRGASSFLSNGSV